MNLPKFKNQKIFEHVFIHRSYLNETNENLESNERLEFLGDSILSFVVSSFIFEKYNNLKEGELTNLRSMLTNTYTLYEISKKLNLGKYLKLSKGEEESGGRENKSILANTLEALIGGIYIDSGIEKAKDFIQGILLEKIEDVVKKGNLKDPKSVLQEFTQAKYKVSPIYKILTQEGPDHLKSYTVGVFLNDKLISQGSGSSKQEAEKNAARSAIENLKI